MRPSLLHGVSVSMLFTWAITSCCLQQSGAGICRYAVSVWWQDIPRALILIQPLTPLPTPLPHPLTHPFSCQCVTRSPLLTLTLNALSSINLSPYSSMLAGDVFFHFLPAACTGYPFWSCIPGCDHSKLHGKFFISFYFDFPPGISSQNRANSLFGFSFLRSDISLFLFLCLGGCTQNGKYPSVVHDFFFFFIVWPILLLSYPHFWRTSCVCEPFACQQFPCACCGVTVISCQFVFCGLTYMWNAENFTGQVFKSFTLNNKPFIID